MEFDVGKYVYSRAAYCSRLAEMYAGKQINPFVLSYVHTYEIPKPLRLLYVLYVPGLCDQNMGFYRRLTDTLRYHHTRCSCASGLPGIHYIRCLLIGRKVEFTQSCPLFLPSFGKLRLSDQVQFIAWHGIQRRIIWIFCRESEVSG